MQLNKFTVTKLFGTNKNFEVTIEDNKLVVVAENGAGKTTLLRIIFLFLSKQWNRLIEYEFETVSAVIDGVTYKFNKNEFSDNVIPEEIINAAVLEYPLYRTFLTEDLTKYSVFQLLENDFLLTEIENKYDIPISLLYSLLKQLSEFEFDASKYSWNVNLLYLPTYRRIERNFSSLYGDLGNRLEQQLRQTLPELDNKINSEKELNLSHFSETENDLSRVFETLWQKRDSDRWRIKTGTTFFMELIEFGMDDVHFRLTQFLSSEDNSLQKIEHYLEVCNKYLTNEKLLVLSSSKKYIEVKLPQGDVLSLDTLSAGEKQIISLFSYLLINPSNTFVIIDEPELSLSMGWQEILLDDLIDFSISGLIVATHSPFIVSTNFKYHTNGINEFEQ